MSNDIINLHFDSQICILLFFTIFLNFRKWNLWLKLYKSQWHSRIWIILGMSKKIREPKLKTCLFLLTKSFSQVNALILGIKKAWPCSVRTQLWLPCHDSFCCWRSNRSCPQIIPGDSNAEYNLEPSGQNGWGWAHEHWNREQSIVLLPFIAVHTWTVTLEFGTGPNQNNSILFITWLVGPLIYY
jgi:hypothetical protein